MKQLFSNNGISLLAEGIGPFNTSINVMPGHGVRFPTPNTIKGEYFIITLEDQNASINEIVKCIQRVGDTLTIVRGQEQTEPHRWDLHSLVDLRETADTMKRFQPVVNDDAVITLGTDGFIRVTASVPFEERTTQLWVGGARQCLGRDYIEEDSSTIKVLWDLTLNGIDEGQFIVLDYMRK